MARQKKRVRHIMGLTLTEKVKLEDLKNWRDFWISQNEDHARILRACNARVRVPVSYDDPDADSGRH